MERRESESIINWMLDEREKIQPLGISSVDARTVLSFFLQRFGNDVSGSLPSQLTNMTQTSDNSKVHISKLIQYMREL